MSIIYTIEEITVLASVKAAIGAKCKQDSSMYTHLSLQVTKKELDILDKVLEDTTFIKSSTGEV